MTRENKKWHITTTKNTGIQDFDGVSLYPSAIFRLIGFLKGKAKVIVNTKYENIKQYDGYYVEVDIINIRKHRAFPLISKVNKQGIRDFKNDIKGIVYLDKTSLEDAIKFHNLIPEVDFKIIRGYYFDEGFNTGCKNTIKYLFDVRLQKKKEKNPIQIVYKLLMNTSYGKTIQKPIDNETIIKENYESDTYLKRNHNFIKKYKKTFGDKYVITKIKPIQNHYSHPHIGCQILGMSKRIMNEVMCLAEDNGIRIFYQDTDSMHIETGENYEKLENLKKLFRNKYGRELDGKNLGQFHCDFAFQSSEQLPIAKECYILKKKVYMDKVEVINKVNNENIKEMKYHIRMKGIPTYCVQNPEETYKKLLNNETISFDIYEMAEKNNKPLFEFKYDFTIHKKTKFKRRVKTLGDFEKIIV